MVRCQASPGSAHPFVTFLLAVAMLGGSVYLFLTMPTGFIPSQDSGFMFGVTMAGQDIAFDAMAAKTRAPWPTSPRTIPTWNMSAHCGRAATGLLLRHAEAAVGAELTVDQSSSTASAIVHGARNPGLHCRTLRP